MHVFLYTAPDDYTPLDETRLFQPATSNAPLCVNIVIVDDATLEVDENFLVRLSSTDQDVLIVSQDANVTISDDDGTLEFTNDSEGNDILRLIM